MTNPILKELVDRIIKIHTSKCACSDHEIPKLWEQIESQLAEIPKLKEDAEKWRNSNMDLGAEQIMKLANSAVDLKQSNIHLKSQLQQANSTIEKIEKEIDETVSAFEHLNNSHQENYEQSNDTSYLPKINLNQNIINENLKFKKIIQQEYRKEKV